MAPDDFVAAAKKNSSSIEKQIISFISRQNSRAEKGEITIATVGNCLKALRLLLILTGELRQLDQNFDVVRYALKYSAKNGQKPLKLDTLKLKNLILYNLLT